MTIPEWLQPISERYLDGPPGRVPVTVWVSVVLAGLSAIVAGAMVAIWAPAIPRWLAQPSIMAVPLLLTVALAAVGAVLCVIFAASAVMMIPRGWCRAPRIAAWTLGSVAAFGVCVAIEPTRSVWTTEIERDVETGLAVLPWTVAVTALGFGLGLLLRTASATNWLAIRRHQRRAGSGLR